MGMVSRVAAGCRVTRDVQHEPPRVREPVPRSLITEEGPPVKMKNSVLVEIAIAVRDKVGAVGDSRPSRRRPRRENVEILPAAIPTVGPTWARVISLGLCTGALAACFAGHAEAAEPSAVSGTSAATSIAGADPDDQLSWVQNAGDVNGDGRDDLLGVVARYQGAGPTPISKAYVIFGDGTDAPVDLDALGNRGFAINGPSGISFSAVPAGDINGDGLADIEVGDSFATASGRTHAGRVVIVFGKADSGAIDADAIGTAGFEIDGSQSGAFAVSTSSVHDLNGDGRDELLVNEQGLDRATVLYGRTSTATVDLGSIGSAGYRITAPATPGLESANSLGDVNGDGLDDLGFSGGCGGASCPSGRTWVSFGKADTTPVDLSALGGGGFTITGNGLAGVEAAGDVNGDGKADLLVNDYNASRGFVVFGRTATSTLAFDSLGSAGFRVASTQQGQLHPIGDLDGDGRTDLLVANANVGGELGASVIFGKSDGTPVDSSNVLDGGFVIRGGIISGATATRSFGSAPRIAVAYPLDSPLGRDKAGSVRLIAAPAPSFALPSTLVYSQDSAIASVSPSDQRRASTMSWSVTPALPAGLALDPQTGGISGTPTAATPAQSYAVRATDRLGSVTRTVTVRVDPDAFAATAPAHETTGARPNFTWQRASAIDNTEPVGEYRVLVDDATVATLPASACADSCSVDAGGPIGDGAHRWRVEATARDGHVRRTADVPFTVSAPPTARLALTRSAVLTDEKVGLDASQSSDPNGGIAKIEFDLDGDGRFETDSGTEPRRSTAFSAFGDYTVGVRVTDVAGLVAETTARVHVTLAPPSGELGVSINDGAIATSDPHVSVSLIWPRLAETALLSNDGGFGAAGGTRSLGLAARVSWTLASSGPERLPKIVYVRFRGGESGRETYTDDIILDERPPQVAATTLAPRRAKGKSAVAAAAASSQLRVTGKDDNAGIGEVVVARHRGGKPIAAKRLARRNARGKRTATTTLRVSRGLRTVYVRVIDVAGNASKWKVVRRHAR